MRDWVPRAARAVALIVIVLLLSSTATPRRPVAASDSETLVDEVPIATVVDVQGSVSVIRDHGTDEERIMSPVKTGLLLFRGDQIWTGENSWIEVQFEEAARVRVGPSSRVVVVTGLVREIDPMTKQELPTLRLLVGRVWVHVAEALSRLRNFSVETPSAIAGVRGTIFMVEVGVTGKSVVSVYEGVVSVASPRSPRNEYLVGAAEEIEVLPGQAPSSPKVNEFDPARRWGEMDEWLQEQAQWKASKRQGRAGGELGSGDREGQPAFGEVAPGGMARDGADGGEGPEGRVALDPAVGDEAHERGGRRRTGIARILDFFAGIFRSKAGSNGNSNRSAGGQGRTTPVDSLPADGVKLPGPLPTGAPAIPRILSLGGRGVESPDSPGLGRPNQEVPVALSHEEAGGTAARHESGRGAPTDGDQGMSVKATITPVSIPVRLRRHSPVDR